MKIKVELLFILPAFLIFTSCQNKVTGVRQISVSANTKAEDFSSLIKSYEVIPLDNSPEAYISFSGDPILAEKYWLFCNPNDAKIVVLDNNGKFINTIGKKGRGPGEITYINDFDFDPRENAVTIFERAKAKKFHVTGSFIEERDLGFIPSKITRLEDNRFIIEKRTPEGDSLIDFEIRLTDRNFKTIDKRLAQKYFEYFGSSIYGQGSRCQLNKNYAYYFSLKGDTIFHIQNEKIFPAYLLSYDKEIFIQQIFTKTNPGSDQQESKDRYEQIHYFENDVNCFVYFRDHGVSYCQVFNRGSNTSRLFKKAILPLSIRDNELIVLGNSFSLEKFLNQTVDPGKNKCSNRQTLDSLIADSTSGAQVLIKFHILP